MTASHSCLEEVSAFVWVVEAADLANGFGQVFVWTQTPERITGMLFYIAPPHGDCDG